MYCIYYHIYVGIFINIEKLNKIIVLTDGWADKSGSQSTCETYGLKFYSNEFYRFYKGDNCLTWTTGVFL